MIRNSRSKIFLSAMIVVFFLAVSAVAALAQSGSVSKSTSSDPLSDPSGIATPAAVATPTPRAVLPPSPTGSVGPVATNPSAPAASAPTPTLFAATTTTSAIPTTTASAAPSIEETIETPAVAILDTTTTSNTPLAATIIVMMVGLGAYALNRLRTKKNADKKDEKKDDDPGCFDLKKRMEQKLEELKDIRGQLTGKAKDTAREKVRNAVADTVAGTLLAQAERMEKEYARLKMLYEQCIAGVSRKKRVYIVHGWGGNADEGWYPWLHKALREAGFKIYPLTMPDTDTPTIEKWVSHIAKNVGAADKNTFFIGHSIGCQAILRYVEQLPDDVKVGKIVLVAPWFTLSSLSTKEEKDIAKPWLETPIDLEKVKKHTDRFFALFSDNDADVPINNKKMFEERLGAETELLHGMGHFTGEDGVTELPVVLDWLVK